MRKIIGILIFIISITTMVACSNIEKPSQNASRESDVETTDNGETGETLDIRNQDAIYKFIEDKYPGVYTREDFDVWEATFLDIDKDGSDELVFTAPYGEGNLDNIIFITVNNGEYEIIPSNINLEKYENEVELNGDFITVYQASGGSGVYVKIMGIYKYDGMEIVFTGTNLIMEDVLSMPDGYEAFGEIQGNLSDFTYTLTKESLKTGEITIVEKSKYVYVDSNIQYDVEYLTQPEKEIDNSSIDQIQLSLKMTKEDIIEKLGDNYTIDCYPNEMDGGNITTLDYSDIEFDFFHGSDEIPLDTIPATIIIKSNKYRYNYDVKIGDSAIEAIKKCEKSLENVINPHGFEDEKIPDWFYYKEDQELYNILYGDYVVTFEYNTGERYMDKSEIPQDAKITSIKLLGYYD